MLESEPGNEDNRREHEGDRSELEEIDPFYERHVAAEIVAQLPHKRDIAVRILELALKILDLPD